MKHENLENTMCQRKVPTKSQRDQHSKVTAYELFEFFHHSNSYSSFSTKEYAGQVFTVRTEWRVRVLSCRRPRLRLLSKRPTHHHHSRVKFQNFGRLPNGPPPPPPPEFQSIDTRTRKPNVHCSFGCGVAYRYS